MSEEHKADEQYYSSIRILRANYTNNSERNRFEIFKAQDLEQGHFDVAFEIEGKIIHAHKFILTTVSETMAAMLSTRWTTNDEPIKIQSFTYDNFYEFLCFLYSGDCGLTAENVFQITDMAEFYGVQSLKDLCDLFLSVMQHKVETVEEMVEFSIKYSLKQLRYSLRDFIKIHSDSIFYVDSFLTRGKSFIHFASDAYTHKSYEAYFEASYKWAEHQVQKQKPANDENFNLKEAIKTELKKIVFDPKFCYMDIQFLMNFVVEKGFYLSSAEFTKLFSLRNQPKNRKNLLEQVYHLSKKQTLQKQKIHPNIDLIASVRADLVEVIPQIKFYEMDEVFLNDFVIANGILTEEEASHIFDTRVTISNDGNTITGAFKDGFGIPNAILKIRGKYYDTKQASNKKLRFTKLKFSVPKTPSSVQKMKGVDWYFCLESDGILTFKHYSLVGQSDYLLAEMKSYTEFKLYPEQWSRLFASINNV